jgi:hypothetical protein
MKDRALSVAPRYDRYLREAGVGIFAMVHDDNSFRGPRESLRDPAIQKHIREALESPTVEFRVPIRTGMGYSERNWKEAADDKVEPQYGADGRILAGPVAA